MLRRVADFGRKHNYIFKLTGIDANDYTVNYAKWGYQPITRKLLLPEWMYWRRNFPRYTYDIALATLFLHHFKMKKLKIC